MKEIEKLHAGAYYRMDDAEIGEIQNRAIALCQKIDTVSIVDSSIREMLFRKLFGSVGKNLSIKPGFRCDLGINIHIGDNFLTNYNVMLLDMAPITIGDNVWIGPNTGIFAVAHPMEVAGRHEMLGIAKPITIGDGVWIGGNATVLMGVTIGRNAVIGAGAVVTHDVPENAVAAGNPARVIRYIENK
ncbi:sugar O-acetyltransferase [Bacteroides fragilis]